MKIIRLNCVDSTNEYIKRLNISDEVLVISKRQSGGKGTKGRSFVSEKGGIYLSFTKDIPCADGVFQALQSACVAVCKTLEKFNLSPVIRWANDVLVCGKKISGTLIENTIFANGKARSIIGIGLNVENELPEDLKNIATTMREQGCTSSLKEVEKQLIKNLKKTYTLADYKSYINYIGGFVFIDGKKVKVLGLDEKGRLIIEDGGTKILSSAEVTLRL